jgi:hypothetical protein
MLLCFCVLNDILVLWLQRRAKLGIDSSRDELLGDDTHDSEDQVCSTNYTIVFT